MKKAELEKELEKCKRTIANFKTLNLSQTKSIKNLQAKPAANLKNKLKEANRIVKQRNEIIKQMVKDHKETLTGKDEFILDCHNEIKRLENEMTLCLKTQESQSLEIFGKVRQITSLEKAIVSTAIKYTDV